MMVQRILTLVVVLGLSLPSMGRADGWEAHLNAGSTSVFAGAHYKKELQTGYMKTGVSGLYTDDDNKEYKWARLKFAVGHDNIRPGLTMEVGVDGLFGDAEDNGFSGDVGALAFTGEIRYQLPTRIIPMPLEFFGGLSYSPEVLSFRDTENFLSYRLGVGLRVIENASVTVEYQTYDMDMEAGPGPWNLDDDVVRLALLMRF